MSSVNNVVDITNFILMDIGQLLHSFDMDKLREHRPRAPQCGGEKITTLDHKDHELTGNDLVICDGDRPPASPESWAAESEITETTKNVFLESAYFNPTIVRKQSKRLGIATDSSYRFERDIDFAMQAEADAYARRAHPGSRGRQSSQRRRGIHGRRPPAEAVQGAPPRKPRRKVPAYVSADDIRKYLHEHRAQGNGQRDLTFSIPTFRSGPPRAKWTSSRNRAPRGL